MIVRKKPVEVEAVLWTGENTGDIVPFMGVAVVVGKTLEIETLEGRFYAPPGWFIIKGVKGEYYACAPDVFEMSYEVVE